MVQFGVTTVEAAMNLGREAADAISATFTKVLVDMSLDFKSSLYSVPHT